MHRSEQASKRASKGGDSVLELAILGLLLESPMHGYELRKRLTGLLGAFRAFSYGSLYPALRRMQADEFRVFEEEYRLTKLEKARHIATQLIKHFLNLRNATFVGF